MTLSTPFPWFLHVLHLVILGTQSNGSSLHDLSNFWGPPRQQLIGRVSQLALEFLFNSSSLLGSVLPTHTGYQQCIVFKNEIKYLKILSDTQEMLHECEFVPSGPGEWYWSFASCEIKSWSFISPAPFPQVLRET